jgi:hypothetical protein
MNYKYSSLFKDKAEFTTTNNKCTYIIGMFLTITIFICCSSCGAGYSSLEKKLQHIEVSEIGVYWLVSKNGSINLEKIYESYEGKKCIEVRNGLIDSIGPLGPWWKHVGVSVVGILNVFDSKTGKKKEIGITPIGFFLNNSSSLGMAFTSKKLSIFLEKVINEIKTTKNLHIPKGLFESLSTGERG